jgi:hypothetical protein
MSEKVIGNVLDLAQGGSRPVQITRVPQGDGRDEKVETRSAVVLALVGAIADFAEPTKEDGALGAVNRLTLLVELGRVAVYDGPSLGCSMTRRD